MGVTGAVPSAQRQLWLWWSGLDGRRQEEDGLAQSDYTCDCRKSELGFRISRTRGSVAEPAWDGLDGSILVCSSLRRGLPRVLLDRR